MIQILSYIGTFAAGTVFGIIVMALFIAGKDDKK